MEDGKKYNFEIKKRNSVFEKKNLFVLSMCKLTFGHGNWKYMISSESPGKADSALLSHLFFQGYFSLGFIHW